LLSALLVLLIGWKFGVHFSGLVNHPVFSIEAFVVYLVVGVLWSFGKWYFFLSKVREKYLELKDEYSSSLQSLYHAVDSELNFYKRVDYNSLDKNPNQISEAIKPQVSAHKASITRWIICWPLSFVWTMLNDPLRKLADTIFSHIKSVFQKMSDKMFHGV